MATRFVSYADLGVDFDATHTVAKHTLGVRVIADNGSVYVYVKAGGAVAAGDAVEPASATDEAHTVVPTTTSGASWGIAQVAIASGSYGFVVVQGYAALSTVDAGVSAGDLLSPQPGTTAGKLTPVAGTETGEAAGVFAKAVNDESSGSTDVYIF